MWMIDSFSNRQDRRRRHMPLLQNTSGFVITLLSYNPLFDDTRHFRLVFHAFRVRRETRIVNEFWLAHRATQPLPLVFQTENEQVLLLALEQPSRADRIMVR